MTKETSHNLILQACTKPRPDQILSQNQELERFFWDLDRDAEEKKKAASGKPGGTAASGDAVLTVSKAAQTRRPPSLSIPHMAMPPTYGNALLTVSTAAQTRALSCLFETA